MKLFFSIKQLTVSITFLLVALLATQKINAQEVKVSTQVDKQAILIGDQLQLQYQVEVNPQAFRIQWPSILDTFNKFEIVERKKLDTAAGRETTTLTQEYTITNFDSGVWVIPAQKFIVTPLDGTSAYEILSNQIPVTVNTVAVDTSKPIKPIFEIIEAQKSFWETYKIWFYGLAGIIALGILLYFIIKRFRNRDKKVKVAKTVYVSPWDNALQKTKSLETKELWLQEQEKEHHTQLTDIIRTYLEDAFGLDCFEKTSQEIITDVKKYLQQNKYKKRSDELNKLRNIFFVADMVKFAKSKPTLEEHKQSNQDAISFIENTAAFIQQQKKETPKP